MIDGAHAVGAMPLSVPSLGGHFYTSNLHKWHCTAKPSAFLWVAPSEQQHMVPLVTSHGYGLVRFDSSPPGLDIWELGIGRTASRFHSCGL